MYSFTESSTLLPEILGFHPRLFLEDIIQAANEPIYQCTEFVSAFMVSWASERKQKQESGSKEEPEEISQEIDHVVMDPTLGVCPRLTRRTGPRSVSDPSRVAC